MGCYAPLGAKSNARPLDRFSRGARASRDRWRLAWRDSRGTIVSRGAQPMDSRGLPSSPIALIVDHAADTRQLYPQVLTLARLEIDEARRRRAALAKALASRLDANVTET